MKCRAGAEDGGKRRKGPVQSIIWRCPEPARNSADGFSAPFAGELRGQYTQFEVGIPASLKSCRQYGRGGPTMGKRDGIIHAGL